MDQLYFELGRGRAPAEALARAKRRLRADPRWSDPSVWSAFVLVGDPPPVVSPWRRRLPAIAGVALAVAAAAALAARARYGAGSTRSSVTEPATSPPAGSSATKRTR
jgi:hypothetical protein